MKKLLSLLLCIALTLSVLTGALTSCFPAMDTREERYTAAIKSIEDGKYEEAYAAFRALGDYKDSAEHLARFIYFPTVMNYVLEDRTGVMTTTFGKYNMPSRMVAKGSVGVKDSGYEYDEKGNIVRQTMDYDGALSVYDYTYDKNNHMIKAEYSEGGVVVFVHEYTYDENENRLSEVYSVEGTVQYEVTFAYDDKGNNVQMTYVSGGVTTTYTYTYDDNGNKTSERCEATDGYAYAIEYFYDADGKRTKEVFTQGDYSGVAIYTYDARGNCTFEECTYSDGSKGTMAREFDENNNLIKEVYTGNDGTVKSVESQYALFYIPIDIPADTMEYILDMFVLI